MDYDPVFDAILEQQTARADLIAKSKDLDAVVEAMDLATEELARRERQLLLTVPTSKEGAAALLDYLVMILEHYEDVAAMARPVIANARGFLLR
jgi:Zn-dependent oligopeptidase